MMRERVLPRIAREGGIPREERWEFMTIPASELRPGDVWAREEVGGEPWFQNREDGLVVEQIDPKAATDAIEVRLQSHHGVRDPLLIYTSYKMNIWREVSIGVT